MRNETYGTSQDEHYVYREDSGEGAEMGLDENEDLESGALASAYGFSVSRTPSRFQNSDGPSNGGSLHPRASRGYETASTSPVTSNSLPSHPPVRLMISNNDQSIKIYRLRQPSSTPGQDGKLESGLPGLSRVNVLDFPTAINHSSLSPSGRNLIAVGDTPEVFLYSHDKNGKFEKIATYMGEFKRVERMRLHVKIES